MRHSLSTALPFNQMQLAALQSTCEGPLVLRHSFSTALPFNLVLLYTPRRGLSIGFSKKIKKISKKLKKARKMGIFQGRKRMKSPKKSNSDARKLADEGKTERVIWCYRVWLRSH